MAATDESDKKIRGNIGDILIEYGTLCLTPLMILAMIPLVFFTFLCVFKPRTCLFMIFFAVII